MSFIKKIALAVTALLLAGGFLVAHALTANQIPDEGYLFDTTLTSAIGSGDTSMTMVLGKWKNGTNLSGYQCFTLDIGTPKVEYMCGIASSTVITALVRGIDPLNPAVSVSALQFSHRAGTDVRITDFPGLQIIKRLVNGQDPFPGPLAYDAGVSTTTLQSNGQYFASVNYVNSVGSSGSPNATTTTKGISQFATTLQTANGTSLGSSGAFLVPSNSLFNQTPSTATSIPVTLANGKLAQGFLDLSQSFPFTGGISNSATTTLAASSTAPLVLHGVNYVFPSSQGSASTTLINNGSGVLSWINPSYSFLTAFTTVSATTTINSDTAFITGFTPKVITVYYTINGQFFNGSGCTTHSSQGTAIYNSSGSLIGNKYEYSELANGATMTAGNATFGTSAPTAGGAASGSCYNIVTMSVPSVTSTGFTIRAAFNQTSNPSATLNFVAVANQ